jgi:hypothetical protein
MTEPATSFLSPSRGERNQRKIGGKEEVDRLFSPLGGRVAGLLSVCALVSTFLKVG